MIIMISMAGGYDIAFSSVALLCSGYSSLASHLQSTGVYRTLVWNVPTHSLTNSMMYLFKMHAAQRILC